RDRQRLDGELLLGLQRLQAGRFLVHVGVDEAAYALVDGVGKLLGEVFLQADALGERAEGRTDRLHARQSRFNVIEEVGHICAGPAEVDCQNILEDTRARVDFARGG